MKGEMLEHWGRFTSDCSENSPATKRICFPLADVTENGDRFTYWPWLWSVCS